MKFKTYSFPSGHSYVSALIAGSLACLGLLYFVSPWGWLAAVGFVVFAGLVGISRIYLGAHFPSDVAAGWILAAAVLWLTSPLRAVLP